MILIRRAVDREHFVSKLETGDGGSEIATSHLSRQNSTAGAMLFSQTSPKIKITLALLGRRNWAMSHDIETLSPKKRRGPPAMSRPITKRLWQTSQATPNAAVSLGDSNSSNGETSEADTPNDVLIRPRARQLPKLSKARPTYKWRVRRGDHASSASIGSRPKEIPDCRDGRALARSSGACHGNGVPAANSTPVPSSANVQAAASTDTAVLTGLIADMADMEPLLKSSAAWGVSDDLSSTRLVSATIKPHATEQWQLTATFARVPSTSKPTRDVENDIDSSGPSVDRHDHSSSLFSVHHESSEDGSGSRMQGSRRGGWGKEEDRKLMIWRRRGEAWPWILKQFPNRTEGAVKARWYMLRKQRSKLQNGRGR